ncbi:MAG: hypothetical protein ACC651_07710 [Candidatus Scalindua sp.]
MNVEQTTIVLSKGLAAIAAIIAITYLGQFIASIGYGASLLQGAGKLLFLFLPSILIWNFTPIIVKKIYKSEKEINTNSFNSILTLCVGVAFSLFVLVEITSFLAAWYTYPNRMLNYESALIIKLAGIALLIIITIFIIRKSKNV